MKKVLLSGHVKLRFTPPHDQKPGRIASLLEQSYAELLEWGPDIMSLEVCKWEQFDREVFEHPETVGSCVFLSWCDDYLVGFGSYDPRQQPEFGIVGHNCVLPGFRGRGFGRQQLGEILRRFQEIGIRVAKATTGDHSFFTPAQQMYAACGFRETRRHPWEGNPFLNVIEYEKRLDNRELGAAR